MGAQNCKKGSYLFFLLNHRLKVADLSNYFYSVYFPCDLSLSGVRTLPEFVARVLRVVRHPSGKTSPANLQSAPQAEMKFTNVH